MIEIGFRIPDHYSIEDAKKNLRFGPALNLASSLKIVTKYDVRSISARYTKENLFLAKMISPNLYKKLEEKQWKARSNQNSILT